MHSALATIDFSHLIASYWGGPAETVVHIANLIASYWGGAAE